MKKKNISRLTKLFVPVIVTLLSLILTGCSTSEYFSGMNDIDFRQGNEGLSITIEGPEEITIYGTENPSSELYEIRISNNGAQDIRENEFFMKINFPDQFIKEKNSNAKTVLMNGFSGMNGNPGMQVLRGKTKYTNQGDTASHMMMIEALPLPQQGVTSRIEIDACYKYNSFLSTTVCLDTRALPQGKGCEETSYSFSGQGGPVVIENVEIRNVIENEQTIGNRVIITIQNAQGDILSTANNFMSACTDGKNTGKIGLEKVMLGTEELSCITDNGMIDMSDDIATLICESVPKTISSPTDTITTPLVIELSYGVHTALTQQVGVIQENYNNE